MYTTTNSGDSNDYVAGVGMENRAYFSWRGGTQKYMNFSNDSFSNQNFAGNEDGVKHFHQNMVTSIFVPLTITKDQ